ncbi:MAG: peptide chain release factor N(5)-glutamine methyltransferase [Bacteroidales bacterium]|nr:peptide chain release factor N(5)-glutamine methyltransferase [Bacteroidales bacterium]
MESKLTLPGIQRLFRSGLSGYYPEGEIRNIFYLAAEQLLNYSKIDILLNDRKPISEADALNFQQVLERLRHWEPIQYVLGYAQFYGKIIKTDNRALIPRPETEELVHWMVESERNTPAAVLDLGTGTGCIAIALALHWPESAVSACDLVDETLQLAKENALLNKAPIDFFRFDMLCETPLLPRRYHLMVSNPPYVTEDEKRLMRPNVLGHEPAIALYVPDSDPLVYYRSLALLARKYLHDGGVIYLEINEQFPREVVKLLKNTGLYGVEVKTDLNGKSRMVRARK